MNLRMSTILMISENSEASDAYRLMDLQRGNEYVVLPNLSIYYTR